ncbi:MAG: hypothetical protein FD161_3010 [Limisphaerales bacterium]|nr:MAG: hypothetical protein FD161_3010 [Limisphaerales bacterium]KAG0508123.1 MAG: hypothetical protein E1N63_2717 [Limisphaerales bacterium]TXT53024.1 MAG: hypothetical protein FD140_132 [Limisphaerales bacterium]
MKDLLLNTLLCLTLLAGIVLLALLLRRFLAWWKADDDAAGISLGFKPRGEATLHPPATWLGEAANGAPVAATESPTPDQVEHFIHVCCVCHKVTSLGVGTLRGQFREPGEVRAGDELRVSHGYCPACEAKAHAEIERLLPAAQLSTPQLSTH